MKAKLLLFLLAFCQVSFGQYPLTLGDAVISVSSAGSNQQVVKIYNVRHTTSAPIGDNWYLPTGTVLSNWTAENLGQIFGLAINTKLQNPLIYASVTQAYQQACGPNSPTPGTMGYLSGYDCMDNTPWGNGVPLVWTLDPLGVAGGYSPLVYSNPSPALAAALTSNSGHDIYNLGTGMGNICYDKTHDQIFVTDMEDGRIYRIDATNGEVKSRYDPFGVSYATSAGTLDLGQRLWGLNYNEVDGKLYFARWGQDFANQGSIIPNGIYSIALTPTGEFNASQTIGTYDFTGGEQTEIAAITPINTYGYSNPVADIKFSSDGNTMLLAERSMAGITGPSTGGVVALATGGWAHRARVLEYNRSGTSWNPSGNNFYVGNYSYINGVDPQYHNTNCSGGADFGYSEQPVTDSLNCEGIIWATGDALKFATYPGPTYIGNTSTTAQENEYVYGLAGIPVTGNGTYMSGSNSVENTSLYQDVFADNGSLQTDVNLLPKTRPGCVAVYRATCSSACSVSANLSLSFDSISDTVCIGESITITASGGPYGKLIVHNPDGSIEGGNDIFPIPPGGSQVFHMQVGNNNPGWHTICLVVYSENPDSTSGYYCTDTMCKMAYSQFCNCDSLQGRDRLEIQQQQNGYYIFSDNSNLDPSFILWYVDGDQVGQTSGGDFTYQFQGPGIHEVCMKTAYVFTLPNGQNLCCYNEVCDTVKLDSCDYWKSTAQINHNASPFNYHQVDFTYTGYVSIPPVIIWNWGDGSSDATSADVSPFNTSHYYNNAGTYNVCATIIWSYGPQFNPDSATDSLAVCCCVDTICFTVDVNPCGIQPFYVTTVPNGAPSNVVSFYLASGVAVPISILNIDWSVNNVTQASGINQYYTSDGLPEGNDTICADVQFVLNGTAENDTCEQRTCMIYNAGAPQPQLLKYFPNPAQSLVTVMVYANVGNKVTIQLMNSLGQPIRSNTFQNLTEGINQLYIGLEGLPAGFYQMRVAIGNTVRVVKLVKD